MNHSTQAQELEFSLQNPDEEVSYSVVCTYNPSSRDMETGRHVRVPGQPAAPQVSEGPCIKNKVNDI